jgi:hypothetical protein
MKAIKSDFMEERLVMDYTTLLSEVKESQEPGHQRLHSLYAVCQQVVDGRAARGKRYDLAGLLMVLVMAKLAGMKNLLGESRMDRPPGSLAMCGVGSAVETHALCQHL